MTWLHLIVNAVAANVAFVLGIWTSRRYRRRRASLFPRLDDIAVGSVFRDAGGGRWILELPPDADTGVVRFGEMRVRWVEKP